MTHKRDVEAINKSLQEIHGNKNLTGGVFLARDFCQTLPMVLKRIRPDGIKASLKKSVLWSTEEILKLTKSMRV